MVKIDPGISTNQKSRLPACSDTLNLSYENPIIGYATGFVQQSFHCSSCGRNENLVIGCSFYFRASLHCSISIIFKWSEYFVNVALSASPSSFVINSSKRYNTLFPYRYLIGSLSYSLLISLALSCGSFIFPYFPY